jgi:hypothetical protein
MLPIFCFGRFRLPILTCELKLTSQECTPDFPVLALPQLLFAAISVDKEARAFVLSVAEAAGLAQDFRR